MTWRDKDILYSCSSQSMAFRGWKAEFCSPYTHEEVLPYSITSEMTIWHVVVLWHISMEGYYNTFRLVTLDCNLEGRTLCLADKIASNYGWNSCSCPMRLCRPCNRLIGVLVYPTNNNVFVVGVHYRRNTSVAFKGLKAELCIMLQNKQNTHREKLNQTDNIHNHVMTCGYPSALIHV